MKEAINYKVMTLTLAMKKYYRFHGEDQNSQLTFTSRRDLVVLKFPEMTKYRCLKRLLNHNLIIIPKLEILF